MEILKTLTKLTSAPFPKNEDVEDIFGSIDTDGDKTISYMEYCQLISSFTDFLEESQIKLKLKIGAWLLFTLFLLILLLLCKKEEILSWGKLFRLSDKLFAHNEAFFEFFNEEADKKWLDEKFW